MLESEKIHGRPAEGSARRATAADADYIVHANRQIEGDRAKLTHEILTRDVFCAAPRAFVVVAEQKGQTVGMAFFSFTYWASDGPVLWVSQMYIEPSFRGGPALKAMQKQLAAEAKHGNANHIVWATHTAADRSNRLWERIGAKDLSKTYSFWVKSV